MKKLLLLLTLFCVVFSTVKADDLTVADGTVSNSYAPVYGLYVDTKDTHTQCIYPSDTLSAMNGGTISKMTFYLATPASAQWTGAVLEVGLAEVSDADLSTAFSSATLTTVYTGSLDATGQTMEIVFAEDYTYGGGNLLLEIKVTTKGTYKSAYFYGVTHAGGARYATSASGLGTVQNFLPKVTFEYTPGSSAGPTCDKPTDMDASGITAHEATLDWAGGSGTYDVEYQVKGAEEWVFAVKNSQLTQKELTNLLPNTTYSIRVKSKCDGGAESGYKTGSFKTLIGIPYADQLATQGDWTKYQGLLSGVLDGTVTLTAGSGSWNFNTRSGVFGGAHAYMNLFGTGCKNWIVSPVIPIEENCQLSFSLALTDYNNANPVDNLGNQPDDRLVVLITTDEGATWSILREWNNTGSEFVYDEISPEGDEVEIDLSAYAGTSVQIAFYGESTSSNGDNDIHVGNVLVDYAPSCLKPTGLHEVEGSASKNSIQVAWTANSNEENWKVQYKKASEEAWTTADATDTLYTISGLDMFTEYNIRVAAFCDPTDESTLTDYCKQITIKTAAGVPFAQNFNLSTLPSEWKRYDAKLTSVQSGGELAVANEGWTLKAKAQANNIFDSAYHVVLNLADTMNYWLVSPTIEMEAGYQLTFDLALTKADGGAVTAGGQQDDEFKVLVYADDEWNELGIWNNTGSSNQFDQISSASNGQMAKFDMDAYAGKNIRIAFYGESSETNGNNNLHIANFLIALKPSCSPAMSLSIEDLDVTTATAIWTTDEPGSLWQYGMVANPAADFAPADSLYTNDTTALSVGLTGLTGETTYAFFLRKVCEGAYSDPIVRTFTTYPAPKSIPWHENFEAYDANTIAPYWDNSASASTTAAGTNTHYVWGVYTYSGNKMIRMYNYFTQDGTALINTPRIDLAPENGCMLSFDYTHAASCNPFSVRISTDNGKSWTELASYGNNATNNASNPGEFTRAEINLAAYAGQVVMLQFYSVANYGSGAVFVDNISIDELPDCWKPTNLTVSDVSANGATFSWDNEADAAWEYVCVPDSITELPAYTACAQNSLQLDSLNEKTDYIFYLRRVCGENSVSDSIFVTFSTPCAAISIADEAYVEDFEAYEGTTYSTAGVVPDCWTVGGTASVKPHVIGSGSYYYTHSGTKALTFYGSGYCYAALPQFAEELSTLQIKFWMQTESASSGTLTLGYITAEDPGDFSTFQAIQTFANSNGSMSEREKMLNDVDAEAYRLAFRWYYSSQYSCCIDDIEISPIPTCIKPEGLMALDSTVTINSIAIDWTPAGDETHWLVMYKKSADSIWSQVADSILAHPYTLAGLEPSTYYDVRVAAWCNAEDSSEFCEPVSFATECVAVSEFPYKEGFDSLAASTSGHLLPLCWDYINECENSSYNYYPTVYKSSTLSNTPDNYLRFYSYYSGSASYTAEDQYAILPEMDGISGLRLKLNARANATTSYYDATFYVGVMSDPADTATFVAIDTLQPASTTYEPYVIPFSGYTGAGKYIAIKMAAADNTIGTSSYSYRSVYIDDIVVEEIPNCLEPVDLVVLDSTITMSSAEVAWTAQGEETAWTLQYKKHADEAWIDTVATDTIFMLENLLSATMYDVRVAAQCSETELSPYTDAITFVTACGAWSIAEQGNYTEGFEAYDGASYSAANGVVPVCWDAISTGTVAPHVISPTDTYAYIHTGDKALTFYGSGYCYAALPEFAEPLNTLRISFWSGMESATNGTLKLGYITNENPDVFHEIETYEHSLKKDVAQHVTDLMAVPDSAARLVFEWYCSSQWSCCIDDIEVMPLPNCFEPKGLDVELTRGNGSVATLKWSAGAEETTWAVEYSLHADMSDSIYMVVSDTTVELTGLLADSTYYARVKSICGESEESAWTNAISFVPTYAITINDGTTTSSYVPFYGYYVTSNTQGQFIVPEKEIEVLKWDSITKLTFYTSSTYANVSWTGAQFEVYMAETADTVLTSMLAWTDMKKIMNSKHLEVANQQMVVTLDKPFQYQGGNIVIGFKLSETGTSGSCYWYGKAGVSGNAMYQYSTNTASKSNFNPKMKIDHVHGEMPSCFAVKNIAVSELTASSAQLSWTNGTEDQSAWQIVCSCDPAFDLANVTAEDIIDAASNPFALSGLFADTLYNVYVRANCSEGENEDYSLWSELFTFRTAKSCQTPDDLAAANISYNSASISWNTYGQTGFNLRYINGTDTVLVENVESPYVLNDLAPATTYLVQVQAACEAEDAWTGSFSFKTAYAAPFYEPFATTTIPADWSQAQGLMSDILAGGEFTTGSVWAFGTSNLFTDNHVRINIYGTARKHWLFTPSIFNGGNNQLTFDLALTVYTSTSSAAPTAGSQPDDKFAVLISTDEGATWSILREWNNSGSEYVYDNISNTGEEIAISLAAYAGQTITIGFYGESTLSGGDNNLHIDNVRIDAVPTCLKPKALTVSDVFAHSAQLSWTAGAEGQSAWDIALDTIAAFNPDTLSSVFTVNENPYTLENLLASHTYYVYVRANCGDQDGVSYWTDRASFTTTIACPAPTGLEAQLTAGNGSIATLTWIAGEAQAWTVEYSLNSNMSDSIVLNVTEAQANLTGLTAEATYYARVKADCGDLDGESAYSAVISFIPTDKFEHVINDGTSTNIFVPIQGSYVDEGTASQFIIPAASIEDLEWDSIKALTFYTSATSSNWGASEWEIYVAELPETTMSALIEWDDMTQVMTSGALSVVDGEMEVIFSEPYQYQGGNLLIGFKQTEVSGGAYGSVNWYGVTAQGASIGGHGTSSTSMGQRNFLPKISFQYVPGVAPACPNPKYLAISEITDNSAVASWKAVEGATWEYAIVAGEAEPTEFVSTELNEIELSGLAAMTDYVFYLRRACGESYSDMLSVAFTTDVHIESLPYSENFEGDNYWTLINGNEPNAWMINDQLFISNDGVNNAYETEEASATFATIMLDFVEPGTYTVAYDWKANGDYDLTEGEVYDYLRVVLVPANAVIAAGTPALPEGYIALDNGGLYGAETWQHYSEVVAVTPGAYKLVVAWFNDDADGDQAPAAIDNISIIHKDYPTDIEGVNGGKAAKAVKFILNDKVFIRVNGMIFDATGRRVELKK